MRHKYNILKLKWKKKDPPKNEKRKNQNQIVKDPYDKWAEKWGYEDW